VPAVALTSSQPAGGGSFTYGAWQDFDTPDVNITSLAATGRVAQQMWDPLLRMVSGDSNLHPGLAQRWDADPGATWFTLYLRNDVTFHDGTPFDANAVKFNFDRIADPANRSVAGSAALGPYDHSEVIDDHTVKVVFKEPYAPFLSEATETFLAPSSPTAIQKYGTDYINHLTGTGPFKFVEYAKGDHLTMVRNDDYNWAPDYWGRNGPANLQQINWRIIPVATWKIIPEASTRMATLQNGETDMIDYMLETAVARFKTDPKFQVALIDAPGSPRTIPINVTLAPTDDLLVRQAIMHVADVATIENTLFPGVYDPADSPMEPSMQCYKSYKDLYPIDKDKAGALLDQAGWVMGPDNVRTKNGVPLKVVHLIISDNQMDETAQLLQGMLKDVGFQAEIQVQAFPTVEDTYQRGDSHNLGDFFYWWNDPSFLFAAYASSRVKYENFSHYANPTVDNLITLGASTTDPGQRCSTYQQAMDTIMSDAAAIPLQFKRAVYGMSAKVQGMKYTSVTYPMLYNVTLA
jgi:peptide/nickel transport system substrate-binding protein